MVTNSFSSYGKWLDELDFDFFTTYTPKKRMTLKMGRRVSELIMTRIQSVYPASYCFWVVEPNKASGHYHLHMLLHIASSPSLNKFNFLYDNGSVKMCDDTY